MRFEIINSGCLSVQEAMLKDEALLRQLRPDSAVILHLYIISKDGITHGYFNQPHLHLNIENLLRHGMQLARRPTGGGIIFHFTDFAFSLLIPGKHPVLSTQTLNNYAWINRWVAHVLTLFKNDLAYPICYAQDLQNHSDVGFCMAQPTVYDLLIAGKKVAGAAQRRTHNGLLHQGSISLTLPSPKIMKDILLNQEIFSAMQESSHCLLNDGAMGETLQSARIRLQQLLSSALNHPLLTGVV